MRIGWRKRGCQKNLHVNRASLARVEESTSRGLDLPLRGSRRDKTLQEKLASWTGETLRGWNSGPLLSIQPSITVGFTVDSGRQIPA
jgi:hypothetical protein